MPNEKKRKTKENERAMPELEAREWDSLRWRDRRPEEAAYIRAQSRSICGTPLGWGAPGCARWWYLCGARGWVWRGSVAVRALPRPRSSPRPPRRPSETEQPDSQASASTLEDKWTTVVRSERQGVNKYRVSEEWENGKISLSNSIRVKKSTLWWIPKLCTIFGNGGYSKCHM